MRELKGLVGEGMDGRRRTRPKLAKLVKVTAVGPGTVVAPPHESICEVYLIGGGGGGSLGFSGGAGGGGAAYRRFRCPQRATLAYSVGAGGTTTPTAGGETTVTLPSGVVVRATGGGPDEGAGAGLGGVGVGGDVNRRGGRGGLTQTDDGAPGEGGGAGGVAGSSSGGGGGGAGFSELGDLLIGGRGGDNALGPAGVTPGGGGHGNNGVGAPGAIALVFTRITVG